MNSVYEYINLMSGFNYFPVINIPAKFNETNMITRFSLIDQIWSNFHQGHKWLSGVLNYSLTDHLPIFLTFQIKEPVVSKLIKLRDVSEVCIGNFIEKVNSFNFESIYTICNPNLAFNFFYENLFRMYNETCPIRKKRIKNNLINEPWVTPTLKLCIKRKYKYYNWLKRGIITRRSFNVYSKTLGWVIKKNAC